MFWSFGFVGLGLGVRGLGLGPGQLQDVPREGYTGGGWRMWVHGDAGAEPYGAAAGGAAGVCAGGGAGQLQRTVSLTNPIAQPNPNPAALPDGTCCTHCR